jgi:putative ABC transport system permease protein
LSAANPDSNANNGIRVVPNYELVVQNVRPMLVFLLAAVAAVLAIACVNLTNLMLARAEARRHEMAVRTSLGAGRGRLIRQLLAESLVLSCGGAALGLAIAKRAIASLVAVAPPNVPRLDQVQIDGAVLLFLASVSVGAAVASDPRMFAGVAAILALVGLAASCLPARRAVRIDPIAALRAE